MASRSAGGPVEWNRDGPVAILKLNHPPVNVLERTVLDALARRLAEAEADTEVRAVVLASALDRAFAAGANIREMAGLGPAGARDHGGRGQALTRRIERLPLPVIAAVHGTCLGGGCEIVQACDFVLASEDAVFGQPEIRLGVMPGWGGTQRLPRRIGADRARTWIFLGRPVPAAEAHAAGLLHAVVPRAELLSRALELARALAAQPALALAAAKFAMQRAVDPGIEANLAYELDLWSRLFGTSDQREGMAAFLEKREPRPVARSDWERRSRGFPWSRRPERRRGSTRRRGPTRTKRKKRGGSSAAAPRWLSR